jgi:hypothetical protein
VVRYFEPWVGSRYAVEGVFGLRLLIVGEAHYGKPSELRPSFTKDMISLLAQQNRFRFYSVVRNLVLGTRGWVCDAVRAAFWERVAFCNFVQAFPSDRPRIPPTPEMWRAGGPALAQTVTELSPQLVLVLGERVEPWLPALPDGPVCRVVRHPSGKGYRHSDWQPRVRAAVVQAGGSVSDAEAA